MVFSAFPPHYQDIRLLARGGMGVLYSARDARTNRRVALKVLPEGQVEADVRARFLREARALARLAHPYVVAILEIDATAPFFAMELVEGDDLAVRLARGDRPSLRASVRLAIDVADALAHVHRAGVLHRDLKPANVIPLPDGGVKVLDFGLARVEGEETRLTRSGQALGTPAYMAPEQLDGTATDARTDIYALAGLLYELLTGEPPFTTETVYLKALKAPRPPSAANPGVTPALDRAVLAALAPRPADRPASASAWRAELAAALRELEELEGAGDPDALGDLLAPEMTALSGPSRPAALEPGQVREIVALRALVKPGPGIPRERVVCRLAAEVERHGGRVERYEPAGLVAFFGLDSPAEAHVERAVAAGIEIATRAARIGRELGAELSARVVIDAARVRVRPDRPLDEEPFVRLLATPGADADGVWVTEALVARVERRFLLGAPEGPGQLSQVTGVDALAIEESRRSARAAGPLLGRTRELARARAAWQEFVDGTIPPSAISARIVSGPTPERAAVIAISGPPGIGKSRLVDELIDGWDENGYPHLRATAVGLVDQPFRLASVLTRRALALSEPGEPAERALRLHERLDRLRPGRDALELERGLGDLIGLPGDPSEAADRRVHTIHRAFAMLLTLLGRRALSRASRPQVVVVEDLEEADALSRTALETALDRAGRGLCLVVTYRPPFRLPARWKRAAHVTDIPLGPLGARDARRLLRAVRGVGADALEDTLAERAGGNPLFLEELAAHMGSANPDTSGFVSSVAAAPDAVPPALAALLLGRFATLAPAEREVAEAAAILGATVEPAQLEDLLQALYGSIPADLPAQLNRLLDAGLLRPLSAGDPDRLAFQPQLARDVLLDAMPPGNCRLLHRLAARILEDRGAHDDAVFERIAHHADASGDRELALSRLRLALDRAAARPDPHAMLRLADRALALLARGEHDPRAERDPRDQRAVFDVLANREHALDLLGLREEQRACLMTLMSLARELDDAALRGTALDRLSRFSWWHRGDHRSAETFARQALELAAARQDRAAQASAHRNLGCALSVGGDFAGALAEHQRALALYRADHDATGVARVLCSLAINCGELGRLTEAYTIARKAHEIEVARGARRGAGIALRVLADLHRGIGADDRALAVYERALATDLEIGYREGEARNLAGAAAALWNAGRVAEARARGEDALAVALSLEAHAVAIEALVVLTALALESPKLTLSQAAVGSAAHAREHAARLDTPRLIALSDSWYARALAANGRADEALELSRAAVRLLPAVPAAEPRARELLWNHAVIARAAGHDSAAVEAHAAARALVEERAARLPDGPVRRGFLQRVALNRHIVARAPRE